jgi:hypothetical protein
MKLYRIKNWEELYENHMTRKLVRLNWVPIPNKHDGLTFRRITKNAKACDILCAFILMVQLASKTMPKERRGYLERNGIPLSPDDMGDSTGFSGDCFKTAIEFFLENGSDWIEEINVKSPDVSGESPDASGFPPAERKKEGNERIEENGKKEEKETRAFIHLPFNSKEFVEAWDEWREYHKERGTKLTHLTIGKQLTLLSHHTEIQAIEIINTAIQNGWTGLHEKKKNEPKRQERTKYRDRRPNEYEEDIQLKEL